MYIPLITEIEKLINEHGSSTILKEHNEFFKSKLTALKDEFSNLEKENTNLKKQIANLEQQLASYLQSEEFYEERGALFKRRPSGGYHDAVYCPSCHMAAAPFPPGAEYNCNKCGWFSSFQERELTEILSKLPT